MNPATQQNLFEFRPEDTNVLWFERFLRERKGWHTAAAILRSIDRAESEDQKRWLRALASASPHILSGQRGYAHLTHVTLGEADHAAAALISQAKKMIHRGLAIRRRAHAILK